MKKLFILILAAAILLSLSACGGSGSYSSESTPTDTDGSAGSQQKQADTADSAEEESLSGIENDLSDSSDSTVTSAWLGTKTGSFYSRFQDGMYMEYEMTYEGGVMSVISAAKNGKNYTESRIDGQSAGVSIMDGEYIYSIDHENKMVIKMSVQTGGQEIVDTMLAEGEADLSSMQSGTRAVDGKTFDTEEWETDGAKTIFCFDGDELAYMIAEYGGEEIILKIIKTSGEVDEKLFEIPSDYQVISY